MPLYVLDTDTLSLFQRGHASVCAAAARQRPDDLAVTVITVEEQGLREGPAGLTFDTETTLR